jgi:hypothetical protein
MILRLVVVCVVAMVHVAHASPTTRADMAAALATITPGMTDTEVKRRLGPPDDIRTEADPGGITAARTVEIWRYGTRGHGQLATLGAVHFLANKTVQYVFGGQGHPFTAMPEGELRPLLETLDAVPSYNATLDPARLIQAVNALQPLGKERALAVVDEYLRVASFLDNPGRDGVFLVMRALFDVPATGMPSMMVGMPTRSPKDRVLLPRFPLVIVGDVPLQLAGGYMLSGEAELPEQDVAWFRAHGVLRTKPLAPLPDVIDAIDAYLAGPLRAALTVDDGLRVSVYDQVARVYGSVLHPAARTSDGWFGPGADVAGRWKAYRAQLAGVRARWNAKDSRFVLPDGSALPQDGPGFRRVWWDLGVAHTARSRLTFQRKDDATVEVELRIEIVSGASVKADLVRIVDDAGTALVELDLDAATAPASSTTGSVVTKRFRLALGRTIRPALRSGARGPVLTP